MLYFWLNKLNYQNKNNDFVIYFYSISHLVKLQGKLKYVGTDQAAMTSLLADVKYTNIGAILKISK